MAVAWEELRGKPRDVVSVGDDALMIVGKAFGKGMTTGAPFRAQVAVHLRFTRGRVVRCESFPNEQQVLEAAGLSE